MAYLGGCLKFVYEWSTHYVLQFNNSAFNEYHVTKTSNMGYESNDFHNFLEIPIEQCCRSFSGL